MCMEYWNGWFDHWLKPHHTRDAEDAAAVFKEMLDLNASVNFYMFHGGTNFGFYNGANYHEKYEPTITSYDYDAPLSECGDVTAKYEAIRSTIAKHQEKSFLIIQVCLSPSRKSYGSVRMTHYADLLEHLPTLSEAVKRTTPVPMELLGQSYGFIVYATDISGPRQGESLHLQEVHDRAQVFLDGKYQGRLNAGIPKPSSSMFRQPAPSLRSLSRIWGVSITARSSRTIKESLRESG